MHRVNICVQAEGLKGVKSVGLYLTVIQVKVTRGQSV